MRELRRYIRQVLLTETRLTLDKVLEDPNLSVFVKSYGQETEFVLKDKSIEADPKADAWPAKDEVARISVGPVVASSIRNRKAPTNCSGALMVYMSYTDHDGAGPFMYDIAMEWATMNGGGLISDRSSVSGEAQAVWRYYETSRPDVEVEQLDNETDSFDNGPDDDCDQDVARATVTGMYDNWQDSPLSKIYKKQPAIIPALKSAGRWIEK